MAGTPSSGSVLTCLPGSWYAQPPPTLAYQWLLDGTAVPAATAATYTVVSADRGLDVACRVTASNHDGSESATSRGVHIPGIRPEVLEAPHVSGRPAVLQQLTCERGTWNAAPPPAFTYKWRRDGTDLPAATSSAYTPQPADEGHALSCEVTATNSEGRAEAESAAVAVLHPEARTETVECFIRVLNGTVLIFVKERQECFRQPGEVPLGDTRLVAIGIPADTIDRARCSWCGPRPRRAATMGPNPSLSGCARRRLGAPARRP